MGLGLALALPWLANAQSLAADEKPNEPPDIEELVHSAERTYALAVNGNGNAPIPPDLCFATHNDGTDIFSRLDASAVQEAVDAASPGDTVKVAGICIGGVARDSLIQTVYISKSLTLEGGHTESDWTLEPDQNIYPTLLHANNRNGRVVLISGTVDVTLDRLYLTGGLAPAGPAPLNKYGGGIWSNGALTLTNSTVYSNTAKHGGGMFTDYISLTLNTVDFIDNMAIGDGGGLHVYGGDSTMNTVDFIDNMAIGEGGGMAVVRGRSAMTNVNFTGNMADECGGLFNWETTSMMTNITFTNNTATKRGGGICNFYKSSLMTNTLFSGNEAKSGGGIYEFLSESTLINATFSGNSANDVGGGVRLYYSPSTVYNSIFWNNQANGVTGTITATIFNLGSIITLTHSLVESSGAPGSWALDPTSYVNGGGNIDEDPQFVTPVDPSTAPTSDGNLRLQSESPAIDTGDNTFVIGVPTDLDGEARIKNGNGDDTATVDMGAYEADRHYLLTVTKTGTGGGTVTSSPAGIDCGDTCSLLLKEDSTITLMANPDGNSTFTGWGGACSGDGDCEVTMDAAKSVTATFEPELSNYLPLINR